MIGYTDIDKLTNGHYIIEQHDIMLNTVYIHCCQLSRKNWITFSSYEKNPNLNDMLEVAEDLHHHQTKEEAIEYARGKADSI